MKRYAFIYNPAARGGKAERKIKLLTDQILDWPAARLFRSKQKGDISELVSQLLPEYDVFVACGGDGTVREVASELVCTEKTLGIIPLGTGNDLCKTLKIPVNITDSLAMLRHRESTLVDVGQCNDFFFLNSLGFGFDGLANRYALEMDWLPPLLRYAVAALKATAAQEIFRVQMQDDGAEVSKNIIMATLANGRVEGGSFWISPESSITDGKLEFITIRPVSKWLIPLLLPFFLIKRPAWIPHLQATEVEQVTLVFSEPQEIHADGEIIRTNKSKFDIRLIPGSLHIICGL